MRVDDSQQKIWFAQFLSLGETRVRIAIEAGDWDNVRPQLSCAKIWLLLEEEKRSLELSSRRDAREERISRLASRANLIAYIAIAITAISSASEIKWLITSVISWLH